MERRPDIAATERAIAAANEQIGIAKAAYFPMLTLSGTGGFVSTNLARLFTVPSLFWSVGPQLAATLFDGGLRKGQVRFSQAAYDASVATYRQTVLTAFQQVEDQLSSLRILEQEQAVEAEARKAAQDAVDIAMAQYTGRNRGLPRRDRVAGRTAPGRASGDRHPDAEADRERAPHRGAWRRLGSIAIACAQLRSTRHTDSVWEAGPLRRPWAQPSLS